jgi:anti-sigma factor RsiW
MSPDLTAECSAMLAGISAFLDGDLGAAECQAIEGHCRQCPNCAAIVDGLRQTIGLCRDAGRVPIPEAVRHRAQARVRRLLAGEK